MCSSNSLNRSISSNNSLLYAFPSVVNNVFLNVPNINVVNYLNVQEFLINTIKNNLFSASKTEQKLFKI